MTRHYAYYCPDLTCRAKMVKRRKPGGGEHYVCPVCRESIDIPEREKVIEAGMPELPGFETEGAS